MAIKLPVKLFDLGLVVKKHDKRLSDSKFSELFRHCLDFYPIPFHISNPIISVKREEDEQLVIAPMFVHLENHHPKNLDREIKKVLNIFNYYYKELGIKEVIQMNLRFVSHVPAHFEKSDRKLLNKVTFGIPDDLRDILGAKKIEKGLRFVYRINNMRYNLRIEPYFTDLKKNYVDLKIVISETILLKQIHSKIKKQKEAFHNKISLLLPQRD